MTVRHLVAASDLAPDGTIADPSRVVHGAIRGGTVFAVGGPVDLDTHCNLDFPDHHLDACVVVAAITPGAPVVRNAAGAFAVAYGAPGHVASRGRVDLGARRVAWQRAVAAARVRRVADPLPLPRGGGIAYADNDGGVLAGHGVTDDDDRAFFADGARGCAESGGASGSPGRSSGPWIATTQAKVRPGPEPRQCAPCNASYRRRDHTVSTRCGASGRSCATALACRNRNGRASGDLGA